MKGLEGVLKAGNRNSKHLCQEAHLQPGKIDEIVMGIKNRLAFYRRQLLYKALQFQYKNNAHITTFDWDWGAVNFNRIALVNFLVDLTGGADCRYLEIGCAGNELFDSVFSERKTGVDPETGGTNRQTSDQFFASNSETFDVIFIDGLHEYEQVRRDAVNALGCLGEGGWIAFHDLLPRSWKEHHVPRLQGAWTGDCWKLAVELSKSEDIDFRIINIDHGVGVMRPNKRDAKIADFRDEMRHKQYEYFVESLEILPVVNWSEGAEWVRSCKRQ